LETQPGRHVSFDQKLKKNYASFVSYPKNKQSTHTTPNDPEGKAARLNFLTGIAQVSNFCGDGGGWRCASVMTL
jgi:hypothetical protein